jgi:hypothetical protein
MPFAPFYELFPEVAQAETRSITVLKAGSALPDGTYGFVEMFCNDERCDCRRAFIQVLSDHSPRLRDNGPLATISFGWEDESFYRKWASFPLSNEELAELKGPALASMAPQSRYASVLLVHFKILVHDEAYAERIARHYRAYREVIDRRGTKANVTVVRSEPKPGMNQPCPCGSGRKYKRCCRRQAPGLPAKRL